MIARPRNASTHSAAAGAAGGFTLVELMVSIALVLIIILGVNAVFRMASDTVNAGQALAGANRENRSVQAVLYNDFQTAVLSGGPMLLIRSERVPAFRNRADQLADRDGLAQTVDMNNNNKEGDTGVPGEIIPNAIYNSRNHRVDRVSFFANHLFRRQTGTSTGSINRFMDQATSNEAYLWIGHAAQPTSESVKAGKLRPNFNPGEPSTSGATNATNFFATDWILARSVTLLRDVLPPGQSFVGNKPNPTEPELTPLQPRSEVRDPTGNTTPDIATTSVCDLANTSISTYRGKLAAYDEWWRLNRGNQTWWFQLGSERYDAYAYPTRPLTPQSLARTMPVFVRGCTQFIVEYAGDYLAQDPAKGDVKGTFLDGPAGTDGIVDFIITKPFLPPGVSTEKQPPRGRRVRWYGMPRNVDLRDDGAGPMIKGGMQSGGSVGGSGNIDTLIDVVPLRDVILAAGKRMPTDVADFHEHFENLDVKPNYADPTGGGMAANARYYAAWAPADLSRGSIKRPKMIRITMTVDDPNGRMGEGQNYEYVIDLP